MRLQVAIHRHALPVVNLIFNTSSSFVSPNAEPVTTVSDLLAALNVLVPLESSDGEWGLEEYTVHVASARTGTRQTYECLHFQHVADMFREDDEVVVRGLTSDELRERRRGGRLQITSDGRRLHDGVAWGKRFRVGAGGWRPDVVIPPRKRRRLLIPEDEENDPDEDQNVWAEEWPPLEYPSDTQAKHVSFREDDIFDDDDDDDYDDDNYSNDLDEQEDADSHHAADEIKEGLSRGDDAEEDGESTKDREARSRQIVTRTLFDDDDADSEISAGEGEEVEGEESDLDESEIQLLLEEAAEIEKLGSLESRISPRQKKRKRDDESQPETNKVAWEGLSPAHATNANDVIKQGKIGPYLVESKVNGVAGASDKSQSDAEGDSESDTSSSGSDTGSNDPDTSDDASESESDDELTSTSESSSESESESDSDSEPDMDSESETSSTSTSDRSNDDGELKERKVNGLQGKTTKGPSDKRSTPNGIVEVNISKPPGTGTIRTRKNNDRVKRRKRLQNLKAQGILPPEADFDDLRRYDAQHTLVIEKKDESPAIPEQEETEDQDSIFVDPQKMAERTARLEDKRMELLARINGSLMEDSADDTAPTQHSSLDVLQEESGNDLAAQSLMEGQQQSISEDANDIQTDQIPTGSPSDLEQSQQRARLDVASSRRLIFHSLGLRNPKTRAAEDALREKLAQSAREIEQRHHRKPTSISISEVLTTQAVAGEQQAGAEDEDEGKDNAWTKKLIITAVECVQEGVLLHPPPFPFTQNWDKYVTPDEESMYDDQYIELNYDDDNTTAAITSSSSKGRNKKPRTGNTASVHQDDQVGGSQAAVRQTRDPTAAAATTATITTTNTTHEDLPYPSAIETLPDLRREDAIPNAIIAYKELHLNAKFEPQESSYRVARVVGPNHDGDGDDEDGDESTVQVMLSKRDLREISGAGQVYNDRGERVFHGFELPIESGDGGEDGDEGEVDDGFREYHFSDLIGPKLVQVGDVQISGTTTAVTTTTTTATRDDGLDLDHQDIDAVPESALDEMHRDKTADGQDVEMDSMRKQEISDFIKDAGFNSALDEQLLQPITSKPAVSSQRNSSGIHGASGGRSGEPSSLPDYVAEKSSIVSDDWVSSSLGSGHSILIPTSQVGEETTYMNETSPPTISMVETVDYPHVSHIQLDDSRVSTDVTSSSHQEAQRISQDVPQSNISHSQMQAAGGQNETQASRQLSTSEVSRSQVESVEDEPSSPTNESFLGLRGGDGQASSPPRAASNEGSPGSAVRASAEDMDTDSDGLPSLRTLTSSQKYRAKFALSKPISPPTLSMKSAGRHGPGGEIETKTRLKLSQPPRIRLSQIPSAQDNDDDDTNFDIDASSDVQAESGTKAEPAIIDLTLSSDPARSASPTRHNNSTSHPHLATESGDPDTVRQPMSTDQDPSLSPTAATLTPKRASQRATGTSESRVTAPSSVSVDSRAAKMMRSALAGLGGRPQQRQPRRKTGSAATARKRSLV